MNDYERRIFPSLDIRQLSRRIRNPDEKPLLEESKPVEADTMPKISKNQLKEEPKSSPKDSLPAQKVQNEAKKKERELKSNPKNKELAEVDKLKFEKPQKFIVVKEPEIDPAKLKIKREEQIAKMKQALERKTKLAKKAAAKAAVRAQKEAEKKLKEREKKAKKRASASAPDTNPEEPDDVVVEATEPEKLDENDDAPVAVKEKVQKECPKKKGCDSIPKVILKKRSKNYCLWGASAALLLLLLVVLGYHYLY